MATVSVTPHVVQDIVDSADERELWIVGKLFERPPYFHAGKGGDTRLARALRVCIEGRVTPNSDGSYTVEGSEGRTYRCDKSCSCPQSQKGPSKHCYHMVSVALYTEWRKRVASTSNQAPLAFGPISVDERLAATPAEEMPMATADEYIPEPEPDRAPTAVLDAPTPTPTPRPLPGPVLLPSLDAQSLKRSMQEWSAQRQVIRSFLQQELKEGVDFYRLQVRGKDANPTLSKAGAEKFLGLFQLQASFAPDLLTWEMLGKPTDHVIYICTLRTRSGEIVGEGRGSRSLKKDSGDTNKAIKMSEKSALIDAVLRTGALSEVYTQDVEDLQEEPPPPAKPSSQDLRQRIWALVKAADATVTTREACAAFVHARTGYVLEPDNYGAIVRTLEKVE